MKEISYKELNKVIIEKNLKPPCPDFSDDNNVTEDFMDGNNNVVAFTRYFNNGGITHYILTMVE